MTVSQTRSASLLGATHCRQLTAAPSTARHPAEREGPARALLPRPARPAQRSHARSALAWAHRVLRVPCAAHHAAADLQWHQLPGQLGAPRKAFAALRVHPHNKAPHTRSLSCVQYTSYNNGGYSYNNAPSQSNNNSGSHYYSPSGNSSGFYTQNGGKSGGGYSYYQNRCAASRLSSSRTHLVPALSCLTQQSVPLFVRAFSQLGRALVQVRASCWARASCARRQEWEGTGRGGGKWEAESLTRSRPARFD